ncbi:50S ribosomal protein L35 [Patescibacteria group bacterium]|nr:50S ribosomal protein L35 [Patescibacteria group bacterium]
MNKTRKTIVKRLIVTKTGKIFHRTCGQNHFNARESRKITKNKRSNKLISKSFKKTLAQCL